MSSKSRKQSSKSGSKAKGHPGPGGGPPAAGGAKAGRHGVLDIPEAYMKAPRKMNPLLYAGVIVLIIFLLVIFIGGDAIYSWLGRTAPEIEYLASWEHPDEGKIEISRPEFEQAQRRYSSVFAQIRRDAISPGQTMGLQLGVIEFDASGINADLSYEDVARLLILEKLAADAGIVITPQDLVDHLGPYIKQYGSIDAYQRATSRLGNWGAVYFEDALRKALAVQRYLLILGEVAAMPDPQAIEEAWANEHVETRYDYVEIELASLEEGVRAEVPSDEELQTWFDGLEDLEKNRYREPERRSVGFVTYRDPETTPATGLLEKYPEPEDAVAADRAEEYYNRVFYDRFRIPEEEQEQPPSPIEGQDPPPAKIYYTQEERTEECLREAPIYFALQSWLRDLQERLAEGEEIDLAAEAAAMGLAHSAPEEALSVEELTEREELGGFKVAGRAFGTEDGALSSTLLVEADFLGILQVTEIVEPAIPPLADIRDEVVDYWVEKEVQARATAQLEAIRDAFDELVVEEDEDDPFRRFAMDDGPRRQATAEAFLAAAQAAGLEVKERPWLDKSGRTDEDPDSELPAHRFIKSTVEFANPEQDEVVPVEIDGAGERAYLVRKSGSREVPIDRMKPADYERYKATSKRLAPDEFIKQFDIDFLRAQYDLWLFTDDLPAPEETPGAAGGSGEQAGEDEPGEETAGGDGTEEE